MNADGTKAIEFLLHDWKTGKRGIIGWIRKEWEAVSKRLHIKYVELLKSKSKKPQKSVYGQARVENARFEYKYKNDLNLKGETVILVDDIVTTGASMTNCATLIRGLRPKRIIGACLGTAYKEKYIDFNHSALK